MNSLNRAEIIGNVTRDPELKTTGTSQSVTTVGVATNRTWTDSSNQKHEEAEFHNVVCWGKLADIACQFLKKGTKVYFAGRLRTRTWEDEAGAKHYRTEIVSQDMIILTPKGQGGISSGGQEEVDHGNNIPEEVSAEDLPF